MENNDQLNVLRYQIATISALNTGISNQLLDETLSGRPVNELEKLQSSLLATTSLLIDLGQKAQQISGGKPINGDGVVDSMNNARGDLIENGQKELSSILEEYTNASHSFCPLTQVHNIINSNRIIANSSNHAFNVT